jgi:hypothetical protein
MEQPDYHLYFPLIRTTRLPNTSPCFVADATGGDPSCHSFQFSPHLARALLEQVDPVSSIWPAFADLRAAAHSPKQSRLRIVISAAVCEARLIFAAAFFVAHGASCPTWSAATAPGLTLFSWIRSLLAHGSALLQSCWRWSPEQAQLLYANLSLVVAPVPWSALPVPNSPICEDSITWSSPPRPYPAILCSFLHTLRIGAPWQHALHFFADLLSMDQAPHGGDPAVARAARALAPPLPGGGV